MIEEFRKFWIGRSVSCLMGIQEGVKKSKELMVEEMSEDKNDGNEMSENFENDLQDQKDENKNVDNDDHENDLINVSAE